MESKYTEDEKIVLNHFFTNLDKPIFVAKNFHPEVWALMQARYSRSTEGMRESFLKLLKEDAGNFEGLLDIIKNTEVEKGMDHAVDKAIKFMDKWVLGYGHSSVAEGAVIGVCLEGISIVATKVVEDCRLASYLEKSTRYVSFDKDSFYIPEELEKYKEEVEDLIRLSFDTYKELHEPVLEYVKSVCPLENKNEKAWERSCKARRFDAIRYLLPACTKTYMGWTVNARELAYGISKMLSHPLKEINDIGNSIREEAVKVLPSLLKYARKNEYLCQIENKNPEKPKEIKFEENKAELVDYDENAENKIITSILYKTEGGSYIQNKEKVEKMSDEDKKAIFDECLSKISSHDPLMREFEHSKLTFDITMDYGAFRDIQRHRMCTQTNPLLGTNLGYETPDDILNSGKEVREKYENVMNKAKNLYDKISSEDINAAQYIVPLAYRKKVLITMNLREAFYFIRLRSTPQGHISYRKIAKNMYDSVIKKYPLLSKYFVCHLEGLEDDELGRLSQETKFEEKVNKGKI
ncbi:MAG: FAD-dependent thymidylate synthase [Nanobdellota archaeon]